MPATEGVKYMYIFLFLSFSITDFVIFHIKTVQYQYLKCLFGDSLLMLTVGLPNVQ